MAVYPLPGLSIEPYHNKSSLIIPDDGNVGSLSPGQLYFEIHINEKGIIPFMVRRADKRIYPLAPVEGLRYVYCYPIAITEKGTSPYPKNSVRFLYVTPHGQFTIRELGITKRGNNYHIVFHEQYKGQCYNDGGTICCPYFVSWPSMEHWLKKVFTPFVHRLSPYASYRGFPELELNGLDENEGIVRWYNPLLGEGYLETYHKGSFTHAWIHWSEIVGAPLLLPGAYVKYATIEAFRVGEKKYKPRARAIKLA